MQHNMNTLFNLHHNGDNEKMPLHIVARPLQPAIRKKKKKKLDVFKPFCFSLKILRREFDQIFLLKTKIFLFELTI